MNRLQIRNRSRSISSTMLAGVKIRQPEAWARLVDVWGPVIYDWCRKRNLQPSDAADIVQEVLVQVFEKVPEFERKSFRGWVWTITHHRIADHFRAGQGRPKAVGGTSANKRVQDQPNPNRTDCDGDPKEPRNTDTNSLIVRQVLKVIRGDFEQRTFQAFWRTKVDGLPAAEVAEELGMTVPAVRQATCRVLKRLREELQGMLRGDFCH